MSSTAGYLHILVSRILVSSVQSCTDLSLYHRLQKYRFCVESESTTIDNVVGTGLPTLP